MSEEASINVPAIAAAHVTKRYTAQATDELTFEVNHYYIRHIKNVSLDVSWLGLDSHQRCLSIQVGDIVSVIDMPPKEEGTGWWRGKHGFQVKTLQYEVFLSSKVPQSALCRDALCSGLAPFSLLSL